MGTDLVCLTREPLVINDEDGGPVLEAVRGVRLPVAWEGCRLLGDDAVFLASTARPQSLDSRSMGSINRASLLGVAIPLRTVNQASGAPQVPMHPIAWGQVLALLVLAGILAVIVARLRRARWSSRLWAR